MMYRVKEEYRDKKRNGDKKARAVALDVTKAVEVLGTKAADKNVFCVRYTTRIGTKWVGYIEMEVLEEWK